MLAEQEEIRIRKHMHKHTHLESGFVLLKVAAFSLVN
uniref:Uncharacterized protein n=1 Tax=Arundo donax TaxID=35708 RepID=A0A0A9GNI1_ARUDO